MTMEDSRTQRPYRYGMILLCLGALINWLGISEPTPNAEPIRYLGVACILGGALLIMTAMCCWLKAPNRTSDATEESTDPVHVITISDERRREKPPDYDQVTSLPPSYDEALKLDPTALITQGNIFLPPQTPVNGTANNAFSLSNELSRPSSSSYPSTMIINKLKSTSGMIAKVEKSEPPPYSITPS
ncbi:CLUMA_CG006752, isoform A [Clunio marinus]|uniref:CLUMA_CG006752, isoform A n=1 Tax=Clunio marinus TaxID=568069 RepID=A0A1J1HYM7_9DIPT|nr:CLUMA_CG006752, isoform A [Clunio marinus]